jgi:hypothetical protein
MVLGLSVVWIGGPLLVLTILVGLYRTKTRGWHAWQPAAWVLGAVAIALLTHELSLRVLYWEQARGEKYPALVEAELDQFRLSHGRYPNTLEELGSTTPLPRLIVYRVDAGEYAFVLRDDRMASGNWHYDRNTRTYPRCAKVFTRGS